MGLDDFLSDEYHVEEYVFAEASSRFRAIESLYRKDKAYRRRRWRAIKRLYSFYYVDRLSDAQFFALMYGMTCG